MAVCKISCFLVVAVACALLCHAAEAATAAKLLLAAPDASGSATISSSSRQLQQLQTNSLQVIAAGQETAAVISRAAESGQMMAILGATSAGNELARETSDRSLKPSAFDKTSKAPKEEKEPGKLMRP